MDNAWLIVLPDTDIRFWKFPAPPGRYTANSQCLCIRHLGTYDSESQGIPAADTYLGPYDPESQGIPDVSGFPRAIVSMVWSRGGGDGRVTGHLPQRSQVSVPLCPAEDMEEDSRTFLG